MAAMDRTREIRILHERMYEQSLLFLALKNYPDCGSRLAATREKIMDIYGRIQTLA